MPPASPLIQPLLSRDNLRIARYAWMPVVPPRATVLIVHGFAEYSGRYAHVARELNRAGIAVYAFDMRGHGRSEGRRAYVDHFNQLVLDLALVHGKVLAIFPELPSFLLAHSMGTTVALQYALDYAPRLAGLVLSGTALVPGDDISPFLIALSKWIAALFPMLPTLRLDASALSHDAAVLNAYRNDPLVFNGRIPARTGAEYNAAFASLQPRLSQITLPLLILHGADDRIIAPAGSVMLEKEAGSDDKTLHLYEGLYHEILNEPEKADILREIVEWISDRC